MHAAGKILPQGKSFASKSFAYPTPIAHSSYSLIALDTIKKPPIARTKGIDSSAGSSHLSNLRVLCVYRIYGWLAFYCLMAPTKTLHRRLVRHVDQHNIICHRQTNAQAFQANPSNSFASGSSIFVLRHLPQRNPVVHARSTDIQHYNSQRIPRNDSWYGSIFSA